MIEIRLEWEVSWKNAEKYTIWLGVSDPILFAGGGSKFGPTSIKCRNLTRDVEPPPLKNCKDLTMNLEVKYLLPTASSSANFYIYQLHEGLEMRKIFPHWVRI